MVEYNVEGNRSSPFKRGKDLNKENEFYRGGEGYRRNSLINVQEADQHNFVYFSEKSYNQHS